MMKATAGCSDLRAEDAGREAVLSGWVSSWRDHGGVIFIDLRDIGGITQVVFGREKSGLGEEVEKQLKTEKESALKQADELRQLIHTMPDFDKLDKDQKEEINQFFDGFEYQINKQSLIAVVRDRANRYEKE